MKINHITTLRTEVMEYMKLLTVTVPCYNSESYMEKCVDSLLKGGDRVEIIIIDDGSKDSTGAIADRYAEQYPDIVRAIHQPNGGHGEGVNQGIRNARGIYYKVVDSDDWVDVEALKKVLDKLRQFVRDEKLVDMISPTTSTSTWRTTPSG